MNILLLGSGGREHAMAWKIVQSPKLSQLFIAPGNPGTASLGTNLPIAADNFPALRIAVIENKIDLCVLSRKMVADEMLKNKQTRDRKSVV